MGTEPGKVAIGLVKPEKVVTKLGKVVFVLEKATVAAGEEK